MLCPDCQQELIDYDVAGEPLCGCGCGMARQSPMIAALTSWVHMQEDCVKDQAMFFTRLYLDSYRRLTLYKEGGVARENHVVDIGWCLCEDTEVWPDEKQAMLELSNHCLRLIAVD